MKYQNIKMARSERGTLLRLQRNVVCLAVFLTFGIVFSKPGIEVMNSAYDVITSSLFSPSQNAKVCFSNSVF